MTISRRHFLASTIAASVSLGLHNASEQSSSESKKNELKRASNLPIIICAANGYSYLDAAYVSLAGGADTLDAVLQVVQGPENDPNDESVGLGGHPNEEGVVELDACCLHRPTRTAASLRGVRNIKKVSLLAHTVPLHTGHVMLAPQPAQRIADAQCFQ